MTLLKHELRQGRLSWIIWTAAISFFLAVSVFIYPEMKGQMAGMSDMFASMGSFTDAFGMDQLDFGSLVGYYAVECCNMLGLGGAFFAALTGVGILAKEERSHTAEYLLTHPISRTRVVSEKLAAVVLQVVGLNAVAFVIAVGSLAAIGEAIPWKELCLLHLANFLLQLQIACVCFGISAFLRRGGLAIGLGLAAVYYFMNLIANITESARGLRWLTPFGYANGSQIVNEGSLDVPCVLVGMGFALAGVAAAYWQYRRKDIR